MIKLETLLEKHPNDIDSTSGVIIEHADTILLLKKTEGQWSIPKGHMRKGETPRQGMVRELKEETQLTLPQEPKFLYKTPRPEIKGGDYMYVFHYLSDHELTPTLDHEHNDWGYFTKDEIPENIYYLKEFLNKVVYTKPNFEFEWEEANRYPNLFSSKEDWLEKAKTGKMMTIDCDMNINNTDMCQPDVDDLEPAKLKRVKKMIDNGRIELPIVVKHDEQYELLAGNTRLVGMVNNNITTKAWVIEL